MNTHHHSLTLTNDEDSTHVSVADGDWSSSETWKDGIPPSDGARVIIATNVTVDGVVSGRIQTIRVDKLLKFDPSRNTGLYVDTIVVEESGKLEIGNIASPIQGSALITFTDDGPIDASSDPSMVGRGLIALGKVVVCGKKKTSRAKTTAYPLAGNRYLTVDNVQGWVTGDRIVIPSIRYGINDEVRNIVSVNGGVVELDSPLEHNHVPPRDSLDFYVANIDRNVSFVSENKTTAQQAGHVMFMTGGIYLANARFEHIGRTDKREVTTDPIIEDGVLTGGGENPRGRYSVHFHRIGADGLLSTVEGCVVENSFGWGYVNHDSNVDFFNNVSFNVTGSGFVTEVGSEIGSFVGNMAIRSKTRNDYFPTISGSKDGIGLGFGHAGHGFWIQGSRVVLASNVACGHSQEGFFFNAQHSSKTRPEDGTLNTKHLTQGTGVRSAIAGVAAPYNTILDNTVFASGKGFHFWWNTQYPAEETGKFGHVADGLNIWNVKWEGVFFGYNWGVLLRNVTIVGDGESSLNNGWSTPIGVAGNVGARDVQLENIRVEDFKVGIQTNPFGFTVVKKAFLKNTVDLRVTVPGGDRVILFENIEHLPHGGRTSAVEFAEDFSGTVTRDYSSKNQVHYNGNKLFWYKQSKDGIPYPDDVNLPNHFDSPPWSEYVDKTQSQLSDEFDHLFCGEIAPDNAIDGGPLIGGLMVDSIAPELKKIRFDSNVLLGPSMIQSLAGGVNQKYYLIQSKNLPSQPSWRASINPVGSKTLSSWQRTEVTDLENDLYLVRVYVEIAEPGEYALYLRSGILHPANVYKNSAVYLANVLVTG